MSLEGGDLFLDGVLDRSQGGEWEDDGVCWIWKGSDL